MNVAMKDKTLLLFLNETLESVQFERTADGNGVTVDADAGTVLDNDNISTLCEWLGGER